MPNCLRPLPTSVKLSPNLPNAVLSWNISHHFLLASSFSANWNTGSKTCKLALIAFWKAMTLIAAAPKSTIPVANAVMLSPNLVSAVLLLPMSSMNVSLDSILIPKSTTGSIASAAAFIGPIYNSILNAVSPNVINPVANSSRDSPNLCRLVLLDILSMASSDCISFTAISTVGPSALATFSIDVV